MTYPIMTKPTTLPVQITDPPIINHPAGGKARLRRAAQRRGAVWIGDPSAILNLQVDIIASRGSPEPDWLLCMG